VVLEAQETRETGDEDDQHHGGEKAIETVFGAMSLSTALRLVRGRCPARLQSCIGPVQQNARPIRT